METSNDRMALQVFGWEEQIFLADNEDLVVPGVDRILPVGGTKGMMAKHDFAIIKLESAT